MPADAPTWIYVARTGAPSTMTEAQCLAVARVQKPRSASCIGPDGRTVEITCAYPQSQQWWPMPAGEKTCTEKTK